MVWGYFKVKGLETVMAIEKILKAAGFRVDRQPKIVGRSFLPLSPDIIATIKDEMYIIEVKSSRKDLSYPAEIAQQVKTSSDVIISSWNLREKGVKKVQPILILVEGKASKSLKQFSEEKNVKLVTLNQDFIKKALSEEDESHLAKMAKQIIRVDS